MLAIYFELASDPSLGWFELVTPLETTRISGKYEHFERSNFLLEFRGRISGSGPLPNQEFQPKFTGKSPVSRQSGCSVERRSDGRPSQFDTFLRTSDDPSYQQHC